MLISKIDQFEFFGKSLFCTFHSQFTSKIEVDDICKIYYSDFSL